MTTAVAAWNSLHLFSHRGQEAFDALLLEVVAPTMREAIGRRAIGSWFFIRYWEGGPHLRIRFRDAEPEAADRIHARLSAAARERAVAETPLDPVEYYQRVGKGEDGVRAFGWHEDGAVARIAYTPEVERYGGPVGIDISEEFFARSTDAALAAIRLSDTRAKRLRVALDALIASASALGLDSPGAAGWLRDYVAFWSLSTEGRAVPMAAVRLEAEREFFAKRRDLVERLNCMIGEFATGNPRSSFLSFWHSEISACVAKYRAAAEAGNLSVPPLDVMASQLHMFQNRLGISVGDECYLAWLASLVLARRHVTDDFHADGPEDSGRVHHETSKYFPTLVNQQKPDRDKLPPRSRLVKIPRPPVSLPACDEAHALPAPLGETLLRRRTERALCGPLSWQDLSTVLRFAAGTAGTKTIDIPGSGPREFQLRTHPSPSAAYPIRLLLYAPGVSELERALYAYVPQTHALERIGDPPSTEALARSSPFTELDRLAPIDAREIPLWIFLVADFTYLREVYGARAYRLLNVECGHIAQNVVLVATARGLGSVPLGGFYDDATNQLLLIDGVTQSALYVLLVGQIASTTERRTS